MSLEREMTELILNSINPKRCEAIKPKKDVSKTNLVLRTCREGGLSRNGFQWNLEVGGVTTALDWKDTEICGNGLHGFLNGEGDGSLLLDDCEIALWMVVEPIGKIVSLKGQVKFESAITRFVGNKVEAIHYLVERIGLGHAVIGNRVSTGDNGTAITGDHGTAIAGDHGKAMAGYRGTAIVGNYGTAIAGLHGTAIAGDEATAIVCDYGIAAAGTNGTIVFKYWEDDRDRFIVRYIGENGIMANTFYCLDIDDKLVRLDF